MKIHVAHIAHLARLFLSTEEEEKFSVQIDNILEYVEKLNELDTSGVEPTSHVIEIRNLMRDDVQRPCLSVDHALANAPDRYDNFYRVPKIIE